MPITNFNRQNADALHIADKHISKIDAPTLVNDTSAYSYTAAQFLGGLILRDPNGAGRTDVLPTAAALVGLLVGEEIGQCLRCIIINCADAAETITISAGSGGAFDSNITTTAKDIGQNSKREIMVRLTNVTAGSEAYVVYM